MPKDLPNRIDRLWTSHLLSPAQALRDARALLEDTTLAANERAWVELTIAYHHLFNGGTPGEAGAWLERALAGFVAENDVRGEILAQTGLARLRIVQQAPLEAREMLLALYPRAIAHLPPRDQFWVINGLGAAYFFSDRIDEAIRYLYEALETLRSIEHSPQLPIVMSNLAAALVTVADYVPACELAQDAVGLLPHYDNPQLLLFARSNLAEALLGTGDATAARTLVDAMLEDVATSKLSVMQNHYCAIAAEVYAQQGELEAAKRCADEAARIYEAHPGGYNEVHARWAAALVTDASPDDAAAMTAFDDALDAARRLDHLPTVCKASERASARAAGRVQYEAAYRYQVLAHQALARRLTSRASVKYYLLKVQHDLQHARSARDRAERQRQEGEAINRQLERLNEELHQRMKEIEQLQSRLASEAVHDPLTGLFNRRYLDMVVPGLFAAAARRDAPLSIALVDLDYFKRVNDQHGHPVGDKVLAAIGVLLGESLRPSDLCCRYGGEEFCLVLPDTDGAGAKRALETLADKLRELVVDTGETCLTAFTFSAGIAVFAMHGEAFGELITAADRALYVAKNSGRNRILFAGAARQRMAG